MPYFTPDQHAFLDAEGQHIYCYGPKRSGKTFAMLHRLSMEMREFDDNFCLIASSQETIHRALNILTETGATVGQTTRSNMVVVRWPDTGPKCLYGHVVSVPPQWVKDYRGVIYMDDGRGVPFEMGRHVRVRQAIGTESLSHVLPAEARHVCWVVADGVPGKTYPRELP